MSQPLRTSIVILGALTFTACGSGADGGASSDDVDGSRAHDASATDTRVVDEPDGASKDSSDPSDGKGATDATDATDAGFDVISSADAIASPWSGLRVSGTTFVDGSGKELIPRGIGIGEWHNIESYMLGVDLSSDSPGMGETRLRAALEKAMGKAGADAFFASWEANVVTEDDVALWASWGMNTVRLPINYRALSSAPGVYIEAGFVVIDRFIAWCKAKGIYVILDLHAAPGGQNCEEMGDSPDGVAHLWKDPATYRAWTIELWQTLAKRYAAETAVGGYDIFDEPYDIESSGTFSSGISTLRTMYVDITAAIRAVDAHHVLFFEGTNWSSIDAGKGGTSGFDGLAPAWDPQMAWAFHKYWDDNTVAAIQGYLDLRTSTGRPVWNGETGEDQKTGWSAAMIALLESHGIGWNEWTYKKVENAANFYSIHAPTNWSKMQTYLKGGAMPSSADANAIMMSLAANAATAKCTLQSAWLKEVFGK